MSNSCVKKINGFFAFFDILGFQAMINNNDLEYLGSKIVNLLETIDDKAITINGQDVDQNLSLRKTGSLVFSDTIILYEEALQKEDGTIPSIGPSIFDKSAILLRLAFEEGIPIRGAISYGDYLVSDRYFLGKPIIEAYSLEKRSKWSGALFCDSTIEIMKKQDFKPKSFHGIEVPSLNPFPKELIIKFPSDSSSFTNPSSLIKEKTSSLKTRFALRWDDLVKERYLLKDIPDLSLDSREKIEKRIEEMFYSHNKKPTEKEEMDAVQVKVQNTVDFIYGCIDIPINRTMVYCPDKKCV